MAQLQIAESYQDDIDKAIGILKDAGCEAVFLFGSLATEDTGRKSDIDLAIRGCPPGQFFRILGKLTMELDHFVDLVNLDSKNEFARFLESEGELIQIA